MAPAEPRYHCVNEIQPSSVQAEASTRFFLSGTGFSSDITLIEFEPVEDGSPGVGFGPLPKITECTDLAVLSSTSATCTAVLSAAADYSLKLYLADDTTFVPSVTLTAIPADEGPALPVIQGLTDSQDGTLPVNGAAAGTVIRIQGTDFGIFVDGASATFNGHVYFGALRVNASPVEPFTDRLEVTVPSGYVPGTTVDLRVVRIVDSVTTLQSEPYAFTYQVPTAVVDSVSPTTVNADTPTRLFITGTGFTADSFASLEIAPTLISAVRACQDLTILSETSATCLTTLSVFENADTIYTMALVDAFGSESETLSQELTVRPSDSSSGSFPTISSLESPRGVGERMKLYGSDLGIVDGAFAGDVIFGSIFASRADINVTEIEGGDDELSVVVPSGYAPGAQVEVRVINAEGLQSAPLAFVYGLSEVTVFPSEALLHTSVSLQITPLQNTLITGISFEDTLDEFGFPLPTPETKVCENLIFREQEGYYICDLPSPNVAGETLLNIGLDGAPDIKASINFFAPSVTQIIGSEGPYAGGTQVTFYGEHLSHTTLEVQFPSTGIATANVGDPGRQDISDEMVILTMPNMKNYYASETPLAGGVATVKMTYQRADGNPYFVTTHPFTYGDLGQPAVVAPSTIEFGEEQIVLVSLPGVSAFQTTDFAGDGSVDEPNVKVKYVLNLPIGEPLEDDEPVSSVIALGNGLFQMTLPNLNGLPSSAVLEIVPEGQPIVDSLQLTNAITIPLSYIAVEDSFDFEYPLSCRDVCTMLDDIEQTADCGGDSQFQACMTSCENDYFGQTSVLPTTSVNQCWDAMDGYLECMMNDSDNLSSHLQCGRESWEQGLGASFPSHLCGCHWCFSEAGEYL